MITNKLFKEYNIKYHYKTSMKFFENYLSTLESLDHIKIIKYDNQEYLRINYDILDITFEEILSSVITKDGIKKLQYLEGLLTPLSTVMFNGRFCLNDEHHLSKIYDYYEDNKELSDELKKVYDLIKSSCSRNYFFNSPFSINYGISYSFNYPGIKLEFQFNLDTLKNNLINFEIIKPIILNLSTVKQLKEL